MAALRSVLFAAMLVVAAVARADAPDRSGAHGFDFLFGDWRVHHRLMRANGVALRAYDAVPGTGVLVRRRRDLGHELDHDVRASQLATRRTPSSAAVRGDAAVGDQRTPIYVALVRSRGLKCVKRATVRDSVSCT
jgi:hypothetical protein